jgi:hypothetical protein
MSRSKQKLITKISRREVKCIPLFLTEEMFKRIEQHAAARSVPVNQFILLAVMEPISNVYEDWGLWEHPATNETRYIDDFVVSAEGGNLKKEFGTEGFIPVARGLRYEAESPDPEAVYRESLKQIENKNPTSFDWSTVGDPVTVNQRIPLPVVLRLTPQQTAAMLLLSKYLRVTADEIAAGAFIDSLDQALTDDDAALMASVVHSIISSFPERKGALKKTYDLLQTEFEAHAERRHFLYKPSNQEEVSL